MKINSFSLAIFRKCFYQIFSGNNRSEFQGLIQQDRILPYSVNKPQIELNMKYLCFQNLYSLI